MATCACRDSPTIRDSSHRFETHLLSFNTALARASLKRLARHLKAGPRMIFNLPFQQADSCEVYSDTDWAGCQRTGKSTSGGCVLTGGHIKKCWSATQASLALSSGESEYYGVVRAAGIGLDIQALLTDAGV